MMFGSVYIAGHRGLVGSALLRNLQKHGYRNIIVRTHNELDLRNTEDVREFFATNKPDAVVVAAARVGGIKANNDLPVGLLVAKVVGIDAGLVFDTSKPDGTPRKLLDISRLRQLGWQPRITLELGVRDTYQWLLRNFGEAS
jgi:nucleoside-diphosphate-sugar epimerase